jgi:hypothetical protein
MNRDTLHVIATIQLYVTIVGFQGEFLQHLKKYDICFSHWIYIVVRLFTAKFPELSIVLLCSI